MASRSSAAGSCSSDAPALDAMIGEPQLLAAPNFSEGRRADAIGEIEAGLASAALVLDSHIDADHNRTVFTLAGDPGAPAASLLEGARAAIGVVDMRTHEGLHPAVGALDVCPIVWLSEADRELAEAEARSVARSIADELAVPTFLYGALASSPERAERAFYRKGDVAELRERMADGALRPDFGPAEPHPTAGGTLITARPPLAAFNVILDSGDPEVVRAIALSMRESAGGPVGVRALGLVLSDGRGQISMNVHDPIGVPLAAVVDAVRERTEPHGTRPISAELVGLIPEAAMRGYPDDVPIAGFDPDHHVIERRLPSADS